MHTVNDKNLTINPSNPERIVTLDVTLSTFSPEVNEVRKKSSAVVRLQRSPEGHKETHALSLDFSEESGRRLRLGSQVTVWQDGAILAIHLIIFEDDIAVARSVGWVPFKQTLSVAIADKEGHSSVDCYVSYGQR